MSDPNAPAIPPGADPDACANAVIQIIAAQRNAAHDQLAVAHFELMQARAMIAQLRAQLKAPEPLPHA